MNERALSDSTLPDVAPTLPLDVFDPEKAKRRDAQTTAVIEYAQRVKNWPLLEQAVEVKMTDQAEFVEWWAETVQSVGNPAKKGRRLIAADQGRLTRSHVEGLTGIANQQVSKWRRRLLEPEKYRAMLYGPTYQKAMAATNEVTASKWTGNPESYTPAIYIESVREVLGEIDLDPASNDVAQQVVKAAQWYGEADDGLSKDWHGTVFLNPPYSWPDVANFTEKLCKHVSSGEVSSAVLLTNNNTDTKWWHLAAGAAAAVCFTEGRINFYKKDGSVTQPTNGQTFFYFGDRFATFSRVFSEYGFIMVPR
jgi:phage N-6-adenine-methyltransferase